MAGPDVEQASTRTPYPSLAADGRAGPAAGLHVKVSAFALFGSVTIHRAEARADD